MAAIITERIMLRSWRPEDLEPFAQMKADCRVMEYFVKLQSRKKSGESVKKMAEHIDRCGWGMWAAVLRQTGEFIGYMGLEEISIPIYFTAPAAEIGWSLIFNHWKQGYAVEGAKAILQYGFETLDLQEIVSCTAVQNKRSRRVMEKIGMHYDPKGDFDHPRVPEGHALRRHVLYRMSRQEWLDSSIGSSLRK